MILHAKSPNGRELPVRRISLEAGYHGIDTKTNGPGILRGHLPLPDLLAERSDVVVLNVAVGNCSFFLCNELVQRFIDGWIERRRLIFRQHALDDLVGAL